MGIDKDAIELKEVLPAAQLLRKYLGQDVNLDPPLWQGLDDFIIDAQVILAWLEKTGEVMPLEAAIVLRLTNTTEEDLKYAKDMDK